RGPDPCPRPARILRRHGARRRAAVPGPVPGRARGRRPARPAAAGLRAPGVTLFAEARRSRGTRRDARGDRTRASPGPVRHRPAGRGPPGRGHALDERRRLHPGQPGAAGGGWTGLRLRPFGALKMLTHGRPSALMLRWLALGAAAGAALTLVLDVFGAEGPWQHVALVLVLLALFAVIAIHVSVRKRDQEMDEADERARRDEALMEQMQ